LDIGKLNNLGKAIDEIEEGQTMSVTEAIEDDQLLLYLGLTNDANPLYIQHDYARKTIYKQPLVPSVLLIGIVTSTISKHFPGPGSHVVNLSVNFVEAVYHYEMLTFLLEVIKVDKHKDVVTISVEAVNTEEKRVLDAVVMVQPPMIYEEESEENNE